MNYKEAGVDVELGDRFIDQIKPFIKQTYNKNVISGVGGFAGLYDQGENYLATGTDGVGTKIKLAIELGIHDTIGEDLVAMCVNDILCTGAFPMFFLDYLATSKLDLDIHKQVVKGIANGCVKAQCALIGGETAEMPGMYAPGDYDLAGFVVGQVKKSEVVDGEQIKPGQKILALPSSGFHSNGYSLLRKLISECSTDLKEKILTPTRIYVNEIKELSQQIKIIGMAHITGGGLNNIKRMNPAFGYKIDKLPEMNSAMEQVIKESKLKEKDLFTTFNMGIGFVVITDFPEQAKKLSPELTCIGEVTDNAGIVTCMNIDL